MGENLLKEGGGANTFQLWKMRGARGKRQRAFFPRLARRQEAPTDQCREGGDSLKCLRGKEQKLAAEMRSAYALN